jgi:hypothetical protein
LQTLLAGMRERAGARAWAEIHDRKRPPVGIGFAPEMIGLRSCRTFHFKREANGCVPDIARACRIDRHRGLGGLFVSAEIIQLMPSPGCGSEQTDFPAIAFRSAVPDTARKQCLPPDDVDPEAHILNNADRTSSNE